MNKKEGAKMEMKVRLSYREVNKIRETVNRQELGQRTVRESDWILTVTDKEISFGRAGMPADIIRQ